MPQDVHIDGGYRCGELDVRTVGVREDEGSRVRVHRDSVKGGHVRGVWHESCATFTIDYIGKHKLTFAACELLFSAISRGKPDVARGHQCWSTSSFGSCVPRLRSPLSANVGRLR